MASGEAQTCNPRPLLCVAAFLAAAASMDAALAEHTGPDSERKRDAFDRLFTEVVLEHLPQKYENTKHWGMQKKVWDGLKISRDGLRIKTKRRWKMANHGTWRRYRIEPMDPAKHFSLAVEKIYPGTGRRTAVDIRGRARVQAFARVSEWRRDVQLYSLSLEADAELEMLLTCEVGMTTDAAKFPPDIVLNVEVTDARLQMTDFRARRLSKLDGPLIREMSGTLRGIIERKLEDKRTKLISKLNREIAEHSDQLRLSLADFAASRWQKVKALASPE